MVSFSPDLEMFGKCFPGITSCFPVLFTANVIFPSSLYFGRHLPKPLKFKGFKESLPFIHPAKEGLRLQTLSPDKILPRASA